MKKLIIYVNSIDKIFNVNVTLFGEDQFSKIIDKSIIN